MARAFVEKKFTSRRVTSPVTRHFFSHAPTRRTPAWTPRHPRSGNDRPAGLPTIRRRGSPPNLPLPILNGAVAPCHPRLTTPAGGSVASFTASRWERRSRRRSRRPGADTASHLRSRTPRRLALLRPPRSRTFSMRPRPRRTRSTLGYISATPARLLSSSYSPKATSACRTITSGRDSSPGRIPTCTPYTSTSQRLSCSTRAPPPRPSSSKTPRFAPSSRKKHVRVSVF